MWNYLQTKYVDIAVWWLINHLLLREANWTYENFGERKYQSEIVL